jgi:hypothetical protein
MSGPVPQRAKTGLFRAGSPGAKGSFRNVLSSDWPSDRYVRYNRVPSEIIKLRKAERS